MKKTFTTALTGEEMQSPFGGWRHHLPPAERWDYGYLAMEPCLCRKAWKPILPPE